MTLRKCPAKLLIRNFEKIEKFVDIKKMFYNIWCGPLRIVFLEIN